MKRMIASLTIGLMIATSTWGVALAGPSQTPLAKPDGPPHRPYHIAELAVFAKFTNLAIVAMNGQSDIVANAYSGGQSIIVVVLRAETRAPRVITLHTPSGYTSISASGIDQQGTISAEAVRAGGWSVPFVVFFPSNGHTWFQLPVRRRASYEVAGIAANGDIAGTRMSPKGLPGRAVEWKYQGFRDNFNVPYRPAVALALSHGFTSSDATSIWSNNGRELIGGAQYKGTQSADRFTVWSPRPVESPKLTGHLQGFPRPPITIGGWGSHVFAVGRLMGIDTGAGWQSRIRFTTIGAQPGAITGLPLPKYRGAECFYGANDVSAGATGRFVGVGGISCIGSQLKPEALMWRGSSVVPLQSLIATGSGWHLDSAATLNSHGQIAGSGTLNGRPAAFLLTR